MQQCCRWLPETFNMLSFSLSSFITWLQVDDNIHYGSSISLLLEIDSNNRQQFYNFSNHLKTRKAYNKSILPSSPINNKLITSESSLEDILVYRGQTSPSSYPSTLIHKLLSFSIICIFWKRANHSILLSLMSLA